MKSIKPKSYSKTDTAEAEAIHLFESCLDYNYVKTDLKKRDKQPNVDGTAELVDSESSPIGKFDVQVKTMAEDRKYSCPASLVAYSQCSTLPVLLICCHLESKSVYWKHVHTLMPELKTDCQTFTIKFNLYDKIDKGGIYLERWKTILHDYRQRVQEFPELRKRLDNDLLLSKIVGEDIIYFQSYLDEINGLLANECACIKELFFPDVWKLGVGIYECSAARFVYELYKIYMGKPGPLLCMVDDDPLAAMLKKQKTKAFFACITPRHNDPKKSAREYIFSYWKTAFEKQLFSLHGKNVAAETLMTFLCDYHAILGLKKAEKYTLDEIERGFYTYLPKAVAALVGDAVVPHNIVVDIDQFNQFCARTQHFPSSKRAMATRLVFTRHKYVLRQIQQSMDFLKTIGIYEIERPVIAPDYRKYPSSFGFDQQTEISNMRTVLEASLSEYEAFVKGNKIRLSNSPYLDGETAIIFYYKPLTGNDLRLYPMLAEMHLPNADQVLPKLTVIVNAKPVEEAMEVIVCESERQPKYFEAGILDRSFEKMPFTAMMYRMLATDLDMNFDLKFLSSIIRL